MSKITMLLKSKSKGKNLLCFKKKKSYFCQGEGVWNKIKTDATAEKSAPSVGMLSCSNARAPPHAGTVNHSVVSTSSHDAPVSGRLRQSNTVRWSVWTQSRSCEHPHFQNAGENMCANLFPWTVLVVCSWVSRGLKKHPNTHFHSR